MYPQHEHVSRVTTQVCLSAFAGTPVHSNSPSTSTDSLACIAGALTKQLSGLPLSKHVSHTCLTLSSNTCVFHSCVSMLLQSSRLVSLQNKTTECPASSPDSHHFATERVHSVMRSGVDQQSFAHTVSLRGELPLSLGEAGRKQRTSRRRTRYGNRHIGMDHVVSRVRRSHLGAASQQMSLGNVLNTQNCSSWRAWESSDCCAQLDPSHSLLHLSPKLSQHSSWTPFFMHPRTMQTPSRTSSTPQRSTLQDTARTLPTTPPRPSSTLPGASRDSADSAQAPIDPLQHTNRGFHFF